MWSHQKDAFAILKKNAKRALDKRVAKVLEKFIKETEKSLRTNDLEAIIWKRNERVAD